MLHAILNSKLVISTLLASMCIGAALADDRYELLPEEKPDFTLVPKEALLLYESTDQSHLSPLQQQGRDIANDIFKGIQQRENGLTGQAQDWMDPRMQGDRSPTAIADQEVASRRNKILEFLGISDKQSQLYIFVSHSMPVEMLRAYAQEAMWTGGILVFRGVTPGMNLRDYVMKKLHPLVGQKGASATLQLDPRLFDAFNITTVPTIVLSQFPERTLCQETKQVPFAWRHTTLMKTQCGAAPEAEYWKIGGTVTIGYALEQFEIAGSTDAKQRLAARNRSDLTSARDQAPFEGDWDQIGTPDALRDVMATFKANGQQVYESPYGIGIGPAGLADEKAGIRPLAPLSK